jgi:hypothetical protein
MPVNDYPPSELLPQGLTTEEIDDPYLVLREFHDIGHLPDLRDAFVEILTALVTGSYNSKLYSRRQRSDMFYFCGKIKKLIEATSIIQEKQQKEQALYKAS